MHEARPGFWVPDRTSWHWLFKGNEGSTPTTSSGRIEACLKACGEKRRVAIDGGAFVGSWTIHLAAAFERVVAFEPITENFECLERNITGLPNIVDKVDLCRCALSDFTGPMERARPDLKAYGQQVRHVEHVPGTAWCEFSGVTIDSLGLKDVDFIKLDLEGHEYEALVGAKETIKKYRPVIMIEEKHDPEKRATNMLTRLGMTCTWSKKHDYLFEWKDR